ncbi:MAG: AI-2E family transporter [Ignavibacteriae bacterium]|nr:AI-2E family transporter [Ignavibacteriota bacterium]
MPKQRRQRPVFRDAAPKEERWDTLFQSMGRIEIVLLAGAVLLMMVLIYTIQTILSPFLVLGAILFLLYPMRKYVLAKTLIWLSVILFALWFLHAISGILAPFIISMVLAYILNPIVNKFEKWGVARWITSLVLIVIALALITLFVFFLLPIAIAQLEGVLNALAQLGTDLNNMLWTSNIMGMLQRFGISPEELRNTLKSEFAPKLEDILKSILSGMVAVMSSLSYFVTQIFYVIIVPFLTFYIMWDFPKIALRFKMLFPKHNRERVDKYMERADDLIGRYLRGALTVAVFQGVAVGVVFSIFGIKNAVVLGLIAGVLDLIPYFGLLITMVLSAVVALFSDPPTTQKLIIAVSSVAILHLVEVAFLSPRIVGGKVGLHPLLIILSLLVFSYFLGFVGLLIAIPATALIILLVREWEAYQRGIDVENYHTIRE